MKLLFILPLFAFAPAFGQSFSIEPEIADSLGNESYHFTVSGTAAFTDSMVVSVELISLDSIPETYFAGIKDFGNSDSTTLTAFSYDTLTGAFTIDLGNYPTLDMYLIIRSLVVGEVREQLIINRFQAVPNEE